MTDDDQIRLKAHIEHAWDKRDKLDRSDTELKSAVDWAIDLLDLGKARVA